MYRNRPSGEGHGTFTHVLGDTGIRGNMASEERVPLGQYQRDVSKAIADTEAEIMASAIGEEEPENDGDRSPEEMEENIFADDEEPEEGVEAAGEEGSEEASEEPGEQEEYAGDEEQQPAQQYTDERNRWVPPSRLREESERRRSAESQLETLEARFNDLVQRLNTQPPPQSQYQPPPAPQEAPMPDRFADPDGFDRWNDARWEKRLDVAIQRVNDGWQREMQNREITRINRSLDQAAKGSRGWEFGQAYQALTSLPVNPQNAATVRAITEAHNPGEALMDWWDQNGGDNFRQGILDQLADQYGFVPPSELQQQQQQQGRPNGQPRHVTRLPQGMRPGHRSLNDARGGRRHDTPDPEMLDDSDNSVFSFATRR